MFPSVPEPPILCLKASMISFPDCRFRRLGDLVLDLTDYAYQELGRLNQSDRLRIRDRMLFVKLLTAAHVVLLFAPSAFSQANQTDCKSLVLQSEPAQMHEAQMGEKYRRPPMVAYEVQEDGVVRGVRLVRRSGIKDLDQELLDVASSWKYRARPGCGTAKVSLAAGPILDKTTALKGAEPELIRTYGERIIRSEQPLDASLSGDMWIVGGTLHCSDGKGGTTTICVGGVATAHLSKTDGRVLQIFHTE